MDPIGIIRRAETKLANRFSEIEETAYLNQVKVINAFQGEKIRDHHFFPSSGYGYGDLGRDALEALYARIFDTEDALVRSGIASGTHAISSCLMALLRNGDSLISVSGSPYDTLGRVIGKGGAFKGTLIDRGISYSEVPLDPAGRPDIGGIGRAIGPSTTMVMIQRSRGYSLRPALSIAQIDEICRVVKTRNPRTIIMLDNCYGEFTEKAEPGKIVDIMAGSLIKNPGGGLATGGGYICGRADLLEQAAWQLTAPGLGKELGSNPAGHRSYYQGLFMAPHIVLQALKGAILLAYLFEEMGYDALPKWYEERPDIVQVVQLKNESEVLRFCQVVQSSSPVDSDLRLEFAPVPGYEDRVVMAAGTFIQGSSIELSCDAPCREPYSVYIQGGLTYEHCRYVACRLLEELS
ncbi:MAG: aminotransferase class I/II-fold pyridoxal phosphate-dependent enzyme [Deltaproteobacteria bacterium]